MNFKVDTTELLNNAKQMEQACKDMSSQNTTFFNAIDALNGMWEGTAHDAFVARCQENKAQIDSLIAVAGQVVGNMKAAASSYESCDSSVESMFNGIQVG